MFAMLAVILIVAWLLGFGVFHVAGSLIHLLLVDRKSTRLNSSH